MPFRQEKITQSGQDYSNPFVGPINHTVLVPVDVTALTSREVDVYGRIKPGLPLKKDGTLVAATQAVFGVVVEATEVAAGNEAGDISAAGTVWVAVATIAQVNQDIIEDNLGAALTAAEIAGFNLAGSKIVLL